MKLLQLARLSLVGQVYFAISGVEKKDPILLCVLNATNCLCMH